jgi:uncharacterized protein
MKKQFFILIIILLTGCKQIQNQTNTAKAIDVVKIRNTLVQVEVADTEEKRALGLMFRTNLAPDKGMLFIFDEPLIPAFYMKNTAIPLDILFINTSNRIVSIHQMMPFIENEHHKPPKMVIYALEVNQGWASSHGIRTNDIITLTNMNP